MEVGKYIDFHDTTSTADYDVRITASSKRLDINTDQVYLNNKQVLTRNDLLNLIYPVGTVYRSNNANFNPASSFGGTWRKANQTEVFQTFPAAGVSNTIYRWIRTA